MIFFFTIVSSYPLLQLISVFSIFTCLLEHVTHTLHDETSIFCPQTRTLSSRTMSQQSGTDICVMYVYRSRPAAVHTVCDSSTLEDGKDSNLTLCAHDFRVSSKSFIPCLRRNAQIPTPACISLTLMGVIHAVHPCASSQTVCVPPGHSAPHPG